VDDFTRNDAAARPAAYPTPVDHAVFLAATAVSHATAFLDGRNDAAITRQNAERIFAELILAGRDPAANHILGPVRLLAIATLRAAVTESETLQERWQHVMGALVDLVRQESRERREEEGGQ
jgi:hypothetical protein